MNTYQRKMAAAEAARMIEDGADPQGLVHILYYPSSCDWHEEEIQGLSNPHPPGHDLSGLLDRYYTLAELAS